MAELKTLEVSETRPGHLVVFMRGEYDLSSIEALTESLNALLALEARSVVIDMRQLEFMDTSGVAVLLRIANHFGPVEIREASPLIRRSIQALGLSNRLKMAPG
ncbi:MAG: Anti-sigma factor antagonist [Acidimicrobiaceae bacterium]|nr:Anti-sigma factor antagonist [Acidimicrobiaceae bacterium]